MTKWSTGISSSQSCHMKRVQYYFAHFQVTPNYLAPQQFLTINASEDAVITCFVSVMPSVVHVSVKTDGGLPQQTVARTAWLSSGIHSRRKTVTVVCYMYIKHYFTLTLSIPYIVFSTKFYLYLG